MNPNDKPITMPLRDWLIKRIAVSKNIPSSVIESVITHQFDSANAAIYVHKSLEISGFGRFTFSDAKAQHQLFRNSEAVRVLKEKVLNLPVDCKEALVLQDKILSIIKSSEELTKRINL